MIDISNTLGADGWAIAIYWLAGIVDVGGVIACIVESNISKISYAPSAVVVAIFAVGIMVTGYYVDQGLSLDKLNEQIRSVSDQDDNGIDSLNTHVEETVLRDLRSKGYSSGFPAEVSVDGDSYLVNLMISTRGENGAESSILLVGDADGNSIPLTSENVLKIAK